MNRKTLILTIVTVSLLALAGFAFFSTQKDNSAMENPVMINEGSMGTDEPAATDESTAMDEPSAMDGEQPDGIYTDYSADALTAATQNGKAVLFFHASWCPTCKVANEEFTSQTDQIPAGVTLLKTDYDTETELKKKYGITYQHTFVQVDSSGNELAKWNGGGISELETNIR